MYSLKNEKALTLRGIGNHRGSAAGKTKYIPCLVRSAYSPAGVPRRERARLESAKEKSREELLSIFRSLSNDIGEGGAWVFLLEAFIVDDKLLADTQNFYICEGKSAEEAVYLSIKYLFSSSFAKNSGSFLEDIATDIYDVAERIIKNLDNKRDTRDNGDDVILLSKLPLPSQIYEMRSNLLGIIAKKESECTSTATLIRALGIPAVYTDEPFGEEESDKTAIIDSADGALYIAPDLETVKKFSLSETNPQKIHKQKRSPLVFAVPSDFFDIKRLSELDFDGIGPIRSEPLYLRSLSPPDEETLFEYYRDLAESFVTKQIIIRALRAGNSVKISKLISGKADDRLELYVTEDKSLKNQLRALLRASVYGKLLFALPSPDCYSLLTEARKMMRDSEDELRCEGHELSSLPLGCIIDTPSQLVVCDRLFELCDFLVINKKGLAKPSGEIEKDAEAALLSLAVNSAKRAKKPIFLSLGENSSDDEIKSLFSLGFDALCLPQD